MDSKEDKVMIYVKLLDEGVEVKRPIWAKKINDTFYEILDIDYSPNIEMWEFNPGDVVECREEIGSNGDNLCVAFRKANKNYIF
jgi:hypothetical protein